MPDNLEIIKNKFDPDAYYDAFLLDHEDIEWMIKEISFLRKNRKRYPMRESYEEMLERKRETLRNRRLQVLQCIKDHGPRYSVEVAFHVNISVAKAKSDLMVLERDGLLESEIRREPQKRRYYWYKCTQ